MKILATLLMALGLVSMAPRTANALEVCVHALAGITKGAWFVTGVAWSDEGSGKMLAGQTSCQINPTKVRVTAEGYRNEYVDIPGFETGGGIVGCTIQVWGTIAQAYYNHDCPTKGTVMTSSGMSRGQ